MSSVKRLTIVVLTVIIAVGMTSVAASAATNVKSVKLNKTSVTLAVDKTFKLKVKAAPKGAKITYKSAKKKVATVTKKGVIKAKYPGTVKIKVKVGKKVKYCKVKVVKGTPGPGKVEVDEVGYDYIGLYDPSDEYKYRVYQFRMFDAEANAWGPWVKGDGEYVEFDKTPIKGKWLRGETAYKFQQRVVGNKAYKTSKASAVVSIKTTKTPEQKLRDAIAALGADVKTEWIEYPDNPEWDYERVVLKSDFELKEGMTITVPKDVEFYISPKTALVLNGGTLNNNGIVDLGFNLNPGGSNTQTDSFLHLTGDMTGYKEGKGSWLRVRSIANLNLALANVKNIAIGESTEYYGCVQQSSGTTTIQAGQTLWIEEDGGLYNDRSNNAKLVVAAGGILIDDGFYAFEASGAEVQNAEGSTVKGDGDWYVQRAVDAEWVWSNLNGKKAWDEVIIGGAAFSMTTAGFTIPEGKTVFMEPDSGSNTTLATGGNALTVNGTLIVGALLEGDYAGIATSRMPRLNVNNAAGTITIGSKGVIKGPGISNVSATNPTALTTILNKTSISTVNVSVANTLTENITVDKGRTLAITHNFIGKNVTVGGTMNVSGTNGQFTGDDVVVNGTAVLSGNQGAVVNGKVTVNSAGTMTLGGTGVATIGGDLTIVGTMTVSNGLTVNGDTAVNGTLTVSDTNGVFTGGKVAVGAKGLVEAKKSDAGAFVLSEFTGVLGAKYYNDVAGACNVGSNIFRTTVGGTTNAGVADTTYLWRLNANNTGTPGWVAQ